MAKTKQSPYQSAPQWVESGAVDANGLDLLALRAPAMRIGNDLLDGITTITPSVRYMTFVSWITLRYWERGGEDSRASYLKFARRVEAAIVLANLAVEGYTTGLVGANTTLTVPRPGEDVPLQIDVHALGTNAYSGPAEQLLLIETREDAEVPHLTDARGILLAQELDQAVNHTSLGQRLRKTDLPTTATTEELEEFGKFVHVRKLPIRERDILVDAILPSVPTSASERRRLASYGAFLSCAARGQLRRDSRRLLDEAIQRNRRVPTELASILDGWARYLVRDMLAVVHEYAFQAILTTLPRGENGEIQFVPPNEAIFTALQAAAAIETALRDLHLVRADESWAPLPIIEMENRIRDLTSQDEIIENGLRRWTGGLQEPDIIRIARQMGTAAPALLPIAWLVAERRIEPGIRDRLQDFNDLSHEGFARFGVSQVILPRLAAFRLKRMTMGDVAAELTALTIEQHLQTAWSRLATEGKDVSVILSDGTRWAYRKAFSPGQTDSRLTQVDNWLRQLGLLVDQGLTTDGEKRLQQVLSALGSGTRE